MPGKSLAQHKAEEVAEAEGRNAEGQYHPAFPRRATDYCMLGATNDQLAAFFGVSVSSIERWLVEIPRFRNAVHKGREGADARVAKSMFAAATGYEHKETKVFQHEGKLQTIDVVKSYAPNAAAGIFWLTNRQKAKWRDTKAVEHSGSVNLSHLVESSLGELAKPVDAKLIEQEKDDTTE